jgi:hypothetical protein
LEEAGFTDYDIQPIQNQSTLDAEATSWYRITLQNGNPLVIGWRNRVIGIQWDGGDFVGDITDGDETTKNSVGTHAKDYRTAKRYLANLRQALSA